MAEESSNGCKREENLNVANITPPEAFDSHGEIVANDASSSARVNQDSSSLEMFAGGTTSHSQQTKRQDQAGSDAKTDGMTEQESAGDKPDGISSQVEPMGNESTATEVENIGHISSECNNLEESTIRSFSVSPSSQKKFSRSAERRLKSRKSSIGSSRNKSVETLIYSEEDFISKENMKIDIEDRNPLDEDDVQDQEEDVDYVSDDTASSISSIGDDTMLGFEDTTWPSQTMNRLSEPDFDVWRLGRDAMVDHLEYMYHDLGVTRAWRIPRATLRMFLLGVRERYQDNPYHNFKHCFSVAQMTYSMACKLKLRHLVSVDDLGMMLTAAICHDVDHPGVNNSYHAHAHSPLAILYNYKSILEQHHFAVTCRILTNKERNIFQNVPNRDEILNGTRELILATDLALHKDIMEEYRRNAKDFDFKNRLHVLSLLKIIIKCADVSNEVRPENVATPWVERLFSEYYEQSAREKRERLPVTPYMDPDKVDVTDSQEGFIKGMMLPMYNELANLIADARIYYVDPLNQALLRYEIQKRQRM